MERLNHFTETGVFDSDDFYRINAESTDLMHKHLSAIVDSPKEIIEVTSS